MAAGRPGSSRYCNPFLSCAAPFAKGPELFGNRQSGPASHPATQLLRHLEGKVSEANRPRADQGVGGSLLQVMEWLGGGAYFAPTEPAVISLLIGSGFALPLK